MKKLIFILSFILTGILVANATNAANTSRTPRILFLHPADKNDPFWRPAEEMIESAAKDLKINLGVLYAKKNHVEMVPLLAQELNRAAEKGRPYDAVVFQGRKRNGVELMKVTQKAQVKAFIINAGFTEEQRKIFGGPREKFPAYLGQLLPRDQKAGQDLLHILVDRAKAQGLVDSQGKVQVLAITGNMADGASVQRLEGFKIGAAKRKDITVLQIVPAQWERKKAQSAFVHLKRRYPQATVVWAANDSMALGVLDGIQELGLTPGKDILTGGMDWTPLAIAAIKEKKMVTSLGAHFLEGAFALVLLHDYFHGKDFKSESTQWETPMTAITENNLDYYLPLLSLLNSKSGSGTGSGPKGPMALDFLSFSKAANSSLIQYDFSLQKILSKLK